MKPRQLFVGHGDGIPRHIGWICSKCAKCVISTDSEGRQSAERCCKPRYCDCGTELTMPVTRCRPCRDDRRIARILERELVTLEQLDGEMVHDRFGNGDWYHSPEDWIDDVASSWTPDVSLSPVLEVGEEQPFELDVERWVQAEGELFYEYVDADPPGLVHDYRDVIAEMQALADRIKPWSKWMPSGRYVDVRPLCDELREDAKGWSGGEQ